MPSGQSRCREPNVEQAIGASTMWNQPAHPQTIQNLRNFLGSHRLEIIQIIYVRVLGRVLGTGTCFGDVYLVYAYHSHTPHSRTVPICHVPYPCTVPQLRPQCGLIMPHCGLNRGTVRGYLSTARGYGTYLRGYLPRTEQHVPTYRTRTKSTYPHTVSTY